MTRPLSAQTRGAGLLVESFHDEQALDDDKDSRLLLRLYPYLRPEMTLVVASLLLMPLAAGAALFQPLLIKKAIDATLLEASSDALAGVVGLFAITMAVEFVARFGQIYTMQLAGQRAMASLRSATFRHIQRVGLSYFDRTPVGRVVTRVTNDIDSLSEFFSSGAVTAVADVIMLVGIVGFMLYLDWELSLVTFLALPPLAILVNVFRRFARGAYRDIRVRIAQLNAYLAEQVQGVSVIQAFGKENACGEEYRLINGWYRDANYQSIRYDALLYSVVEAVSVACIAIVLYYASVRLGYLEDTAASRAYVGTVVAFYEYIQRFFIPIRDLSTKYTIIQSSLASAERIFGLLDVSELDAPVGSGPSGEPPAVVQDAAVAFDGVTFAYRAGYPALRDVSFAMRKGEKLALVGATGSGKTTVTALLLRMYEPQDGWVAIEGKDVRHWSRETLRRKFSVVPQDVFLFSGTILDNIALGDERPDPDRALEALAAVGALDLVRSRSGGLEARVEERGANFSVGERQLLAFARALYRDSEYLILDEATANIDSETEARLQTAVGRLLEGRTSIVIAHRLSTIRNADRILVLHHGSVAEQGTHDELIAAGGIYARLHQLSFASDPTQEPTFG